MPDSVVTQIGKLYTKVEVMEQKVSTLQETMDAHITDGKELSSEIRKMSEKINNLVYTVNNNYQRLEESKISIKSLELKMEELYKKQIEYNTFIGITKWFIGSASALGGIVGSIITYFTLIKK